MKIKNNTFLVAFLLILSVILFSAAIPYRDGFKNLQVLPKNISEKKLDDIMHQFNEGLAVNCEYCHVRDSKTGHMAFELDDKPEKDMARGMIKLTDSINYTYFRQYDKDSMLVWRVTCYTCHHGDPYPDANKPAKPINLLKGN